MLQLQTQLAALLALWPCNPAPDCIPKTGNLFDQKLADRNSHSSSKHNNREGKWPRCWPGGDGGTLHLQWNAVSRGKQGAEEPYDSDDPDAE